MYKEIIYKLAGDDYGIIRSCEKPTQERFLIIGLFVPTIFLLCLISLFFTFRQVFNSISACLALSLFFSWMISNMYRLLLYTITKSALPDVKDKADNKTSLALRVLFVCFISLVISIPIESLFYSSSLNKDMKTFKIKTKEENKNAILTYYNLQYTEINKISKSPLYQEQFKARKEKERERVTNNMYHFVDISNYYLQRVKLLCSKYPTSWIFTIPFMLFLNIPVYLKYKMRLSDYYLRKGVIERRIVELNYQAFRKKYSAILLKKYDQKVVFSEKYQDAPYNTIKKRDERVYHSEEFLLSELYNV